MFEGDLIGFDKLIGFKLGAHRAPDLKIKPTAASFRAIG
jgi:hypothetical protein